MGRRTGAGRAAGRAVARVRPLGRGDNRRVPGAVAPGRGPGRGGHRRGDPGRGDRRARPERQAVLHGTGGADACTRGRAGSAVVRLTPRNLHDLRRAGGQRDGHHRCALCGASRLARVARVEARRLRSMDRPAAFRRRSGHPRRVPRTWPSKAWWRSGSSSVYRPGARSPDWVKVKHEQTGDYVVGGWRTGRRDLGALLVGTPGVGGLRYRGRVGGGISAANERHLLARLDPLRVARIALRRAAAP